VLLIILPSAKFALLPRFLHAENINPEEICRELCAVYGQNIMSEDNDVECSKMGEEIFTMKSEVVGRPSVVSDDLVQRVDQKNGERRCFTISEPSCEFPQILFTVLY
jgi:hypothetical protein